MDENKISRPVPVAGNQPPAQTPPPEEEAPQEEVLDENVFYNVMPPVKNSAAVVGPKVAVQETAPKKEPTGDSFLKKHLKAIIIVAAVIVIGGLAYVFLSKYIQDQYKPDDIVVVNTPKSNNDNTASSTPAAGDDVKAWQKKYFGSEICQNQSLCGNDADADHDGLTNDEEYKAKTDPNNRDSDGDGLSDGDESKVFYSDPLQAKTAENPQFNDADYLRGGFDIMAYRAAKKDQKLSDEKIAEISNRMKQLGLHEPTISTLKDILETIYKFTPQSQPSNGNATTTQASAAVQSASITLPNSIDLSPEAKQDRDAQRSSTIKNIGIALVKHQQSRSAFPDTSVFAEMAEQVKIFNRVALNPLDPINREPYVYTYAVSADGRDFTLAFFSETQNQLIKKHAADSIKDMQKGQAEMNDEQRKNDMKMVQSALLLYSNNNAAGNQDYVFPQETKYKTAIVPEYLSAVPKDPKTGQDYEYKVSEQFNTFTLKALLEDPPTGTTGYLCNQDECRYY